MQLLLVQFRPQVMRSKSHSWRMLILSTGQIIRPVKMPGSGRVKSKLDTAGESSSASSSGTQCGIRNHPSVQRVTSGSLVQPGVASPAMDSYGFLINDSICFAINKRKSQYWPHIKCCEELEKFREHWLLVELDNYCWKNIHYQWITRHWPL